MLTEYPLDPISRLHDAIVSGDITTAAATAAMLASAFAADDVPPSAIPALPAPPAIEARI